MRISNSTLSYVVMMVIFGAYLYARAPLLKSSVSQVEPVEEETASSEETVNQNDSSAKTKSRFINSVGAAPGHVSHPAMDQNGSQKIDAISRALKDVPRGEILLGILDATENWDQVPAKRAEHQRLMAEMQRNQELSFRMLSESLDRLPREQFAFERAGVLELMETLPKKREETRAIALKESIEAINSPRPDVLTAKNEAEQDLALSTDHSMLLPIIAAEVFVKTARDFEDALSGVLGAVRSQRDRHTREQIAIRLLRQFPQESERIVREMKAFQIDISPSDGEGQ